MLRNALLFMLLAAPAWATDQFPGVIKTRYSLASAPACNLCHTNGITAIGTVTTRFGASLRARGLVANDVASLNSALDALATGMVDSDGDTVTDVAELMAGTDPNTATAAVDGGTGGGGGGGGGAGGGGGTTAGPLRYGCGASVVPELLAFGLLVPLLRRRARR